MMGWMGIVTEGKVLSLWSTSEVARSLWKVLCSGIRMSKVPDGI